MSVHYCFIAKDSDMVVFEHLVTRDINKSALNNEAIERVTAWESTNKKMTEPDADEESADIYYDCKPLSGVAAGANRSVELHSIYKCIHFGIVTDLDYGEDKARAFLVELHKKMVTFYKGSLTFIHKQAKLKPNILDNRFKNDFLTVYDNHDTGIKSKNLNAAQRKADEVKDIA